MMPGKKRILLNISGEIFETYEATINLFPNTLLGDKNKRMLHYCDKTGHHFFNRNRTCFESILYFYQSRGTLLCPKGTSISIFEKECEYFQVPQTMINDMKKKEGIIFDLDDDKTNGTLSIRQHIWNILENPDTSRAAWIFGMFSLIIVWVSIITGAMETVNEYHSHFEDSKLLWGDYWSAVELSLNLYFLVELCLRLIFSTNKLEFLHMSMNWIDMLAVAPYFFLLFLKSNKSSILGTFKTLKFLRVIRLFRLSKHSRRIKVVGTILKSSLSNFRILMVCLFMVIFLGGTIIYFVESADNEDVFMSIPHSLWWAVQTITSVGYGDMIPITIVGRTFACCFMLFGALTISLPVLTIVCQFTDLYPKNVECDEYAQQYKY